MPEFSMARMPPSKTNPSRSKELTSPPTFGSFSKSRTVRPAFAR